jgi:hypothetical protein
VHMTPLGGQNWPSTISLNASPCPLSYWVVCVSLRCSEYHWWSFVFFPYFSLSWQIMYNIVIFVSYFSISIFILLISHFILFLSIEAFYLFNLFLQLQFFICFFFNFSPHSFNFLFHYYSFYKSVFFQYSLSIAISHMFCFSF